MVHASFFPYTLQFNRPAGTSRGVLRTKETYLLRVADVEQPGICGWGECGPVAGLSVDGANLPEGVTFAEELGRICAEINRGKAAETVDRVAYPALAFGVEMALLDLANGGERILYETPFSRGQEALATHGLIWMDTHEGILRQIEKKAEAGFTTIKMKVGALPFREEVALLADVRKSFPADKFMLRLDANGAFDAEDALQKLEVLARFDIHFIEQPVRPQRATNFSPNAFSQNIKVDWQPLTALCRQSPIPICLDEELIGVQSEADRRSLLETVQPQHIIIKPTLLGGFSASEAWSSDAKELGIEWWVNSLLESNIGLNAICQWASSLADHRVHGLGTGQLFGNNIPSPLRTNGERVVYSHSRGWDLSVLNQV